MQKPPVAPTPTVVDAWRWQRPVLVLADPFIYKIDI